MPKITKRTKREDGPRAAVAKLEDARTLLTRIRQALDKEILDILNRHDYDSLPDKVLESICAYAGECDAVCGACDLIAALVIRTLRDDGVNVPEDCAVTGFDDCEIASTADPPLTTVRQPFRRMGESAVDLLLALEAGKLKGPAQWTVEPQLVLRGSSGV